MSVNAERSTLVMKRRRALLPAALIAALVVGLDQLTKHTLGTSIRPYEVRHLIPGLSLVHVRNTGVSFSFLSGAGALVYVVVGLALVGLVVYLLARPTRPLLWLPTGLLIGGAIGNLIDRVARGSVIDFIQLPHWPAFNLADASITCGVIALALVIERGARVSSGGTGAAEGAGPARSSAALPSQADEDQLKRTPEPAAHRHDER